MPLSLDLINDGTAAEFVDALIEEALAHRAVHHPYLERLARGRLPNTEAALRDYAHQYSHYSNWFTKYLDGVIKNLPDQAHRDMLLENLEEENGDPDSDKLEERPHTEIFADFKRQIGADQNYAAAHPISTTVQIWRDLFLQKCESPVLGVGLGAIGLATEYIVPSFYPYIIQAIHEHTDLGEEGSLFFRLHVDCDEEHADQMIQITASVCEDPSLREGVRFGVRSALNLREAFWDSQLVRSMAMGS